MTSWPSKVVTITDGEEVEQQVINRPLSQLVNRTSYLFERLQSAGVGESIIVTNVVLSTSTIAGTPVYYDAASGSFKPAVSEISTDEDSYGLPKDESRVNGVVLTKHTDASGDVILAGELDNSVWDIDWTTIIDSGTLTAGTYFLSSTSGKITTSVNNLAAFVGFLDSSGNMYVQPNIQGDLRSHVHFRFDLTSSLGAAITDSGWLPASVFTANGISVPSGYTHGYNISKDSDLNSRFPPVPLLAHALFYNGQLENHQEAYLINNDGIWWDSSYGTPWTLDSSLFLIELFGSTSIVSSLAPSAEAGIVPLTVRDAQDSDAATGDLKIGLNLSDAIGSVTNDSSPTAVKSRGSDGKLRLGPIVSRIIPGSNVNIESDNGDATDGYYGSLRLSVGTSGNAVVQPAIAALDGATEDFYGIWPSTVFPKGRSSSITYLIQVPTNLLSSRVARLYMDVIGPVTLASQSLGIDYALARVGNDAPTSFTSLTDLSFSLTSGKVTRITSASVSVEPGDTLLLKVSQEAASPTYDLPIIRSQVTISGS